jgi:hypothetical protein
LSLFAPHSALVAEAQKRLSAHTALSLSSWLEKWRCFFSLFIAPLGVVIFSQNSIPYFILKKTWLAGKYVALRRLKNGREQKAKSANFILPCGLQTQV